MFSDDEGPVFLNGIRVLADLVVVSTASSSSSALPVAPAASSSSSALPVALVVTPAITPVVEEAEPVDRIGNVELGIVKDSNHICFDVSEGKIWVTSTISNESKPLLDGQWKHEVEDDGTSIFSSIADPDNILFADDVLDLEVWQPEFGQIVLRKSRGVGEGAL